MQGRDDRAALGVAEQEIDEKALMGEVQVRSSFHQAGGEGKKATAALRQEAKTLQRDATALADHAAYLSNKINFLLDATLGLINLEQNQIIKIFTVAAVAFLPPTLVASVYGMNFDW